MLDYDKDYTQEKTKRGGEMAESLGIERWNGGRTDQTKSSPRQNETLLYEHIKWRTMFPTSRRSLNLKNVHLMFAVWTWQGVHSPRDRSSLCQLNPFAALEFDTSWRVNTDDQKFLMEGCGQMSNSIIPSTALHKVWVIYGGAGRS